MYGTDTEAAWRLPAQELGSFLAVETREELVVDRSAQGELLRINFNISFPSLSCEFATLDVSDALGTVRRLFHSPPAPRMHPSYSPDKCLATTRMTMLEAFRHHPLYGCVLL